MKKETYIKIFTKIEKMPHGVCGLRFAGKILTYLTGIIYFVAVSGQLFQKEWTGAVALLLVPAVSFVAVSVFRKCYDAKRPYEIYGFKPLIAKDTKGKSFPSRHVFSIFIIGSSLFWIYPYAGGIVCLMGIGLAGIRVASGVHFPKDVAAGAVIGLVCGCMVKILLQASFTC